MKPVPSREKELKRVGMTIYTADYKKLMEIGKQNKRKTNFSETLRTIIRDYLDRIEK